MNTESSALLKSLSDQRGHVTGALEGLPDATLRRAALPSGWTCLGMVQHLTISVERFWFRGVIAGEPIELTLADDAYAEAWRVGDDVPAEGVLAAYRQEIALADAVIAATPLDAPPAMWPDKLWPDWKIPDLRSTILHVITETACHAGHLDAACELLAGRSWTP
jgi:hypothetical protein